MALKPGVSNKIIDIPNICFHMGKYMAIWSLTCQWRHQKSKGDLSREQKVILQGNFFCSLLCLKFKNIYLFHFSCQSSLNSICTYRFEIETTTHYFLHCSIFANETIALLDKIRNINTSIL